MTTKPAPIEIGRRLRKIRMRKKWTLAEMAKRAGMDDSNYQKIELGKKDIQLTTLLKILAGVGMTLEDFGRMRG